ncbi:SDR family oxidoreductase [Uliginosibacterium sp. 31-16]|uniref:SDR family oxidoreductase n=1 Tax=Uliginosibacterium sp. 31-16 TaxID=3068315 RepID=UPI00273E2BD2|nr:SDR family oxidoreductase [Uliginosibacterium sp. 31-16]MDP5239823.1 SDR family oxidoreductase [Uliginosibacterium sp. 31-16]
MIVITGASGQLGRLVIEALLKKIPASEIVATVRKPESVADFAARGVQVRIADYDRPETLASAFAGAAKLLLISASEVGRRLPQHRAVIEAAKAAGVGLVAYTSILHADTSPLPLAAEHKATEALLAESGLPHVLLRNGWYTENYLASVPVALQHGAVFGSAGEGRISSASRADYAEAAAAVLLTSDQAGKVYELAGDGSYTLAELAAEIGRQAGKSVVYTDLPEADYTGALIAAGLPDWLAGLLASSDVGASKGGLFDTSRSLSQLIGRPTTPLVESLRHALASGS